MKEKILNILKRFKSPVVITGVLGQIVLLIAIFNPNVSDLVKQIGTILIEILTLLGFVNNPTDSNNL